MKTIGIGTVMVLAMAAMACGKPAPDTSSTLKVTGAIDTKTQALDNASAVAIGSDGRTFSAYLQKNGRFTLQLPVGHVYRIIIANSTMGGELRPIGHLVNATSKGKSDVIAVKDGGSLNLGTLHPVGASSSALHTACDCEGGSSGGEKSGEGDKTDDGSGDTSADGYGDEGDGDKGDGDKGGDYKSQQKDQDKDRVCEGSTDVELEADHAPGDKCAKDDGAEDAPKPKAKSCSTKDDNKDGKDDDSSKGSDDKKSGDDKSAGDKSGDDKSGGDKSAGGDDKSAGGDDKGAPEPPTSCTCSKQCGSGSSCTASKCTSDKPADPGSPKPK